MLELAFFNQNELFSAFKEIINKRDIYFYFMHPSKFYAFPIDTSDFDVIQYVSKDTNNKVIGYFSAYINHPNECIENLDIINFTGSPSIIFSRDTKLFFDEIFLVRKFRKLKFHAILQNPAIPMYRKLIKRLNGREVGILKESKKLLDGKYYDEIIFEVFRGEYLHATK